MTIGINIVDEFVKLKAKRTLDGNILIVDHEDIDIVLMPESLKCVAFAKEEMNDKVYDTQDRLYSFLSQKGVIDRASVRCGSVFGSMEAKVLESKLPGIDSVQAILLSINEYLDTERPYFLNRMNYTDDQIDHLLRPAPEYSTEFGEVPQEPNKGAMDPKVRPYGYQYNYSILREKKEEDS